METQKRPTVFATRYLHFLIGAAIVALLWWNYRHPRPVQLDSGYRPVMGTVAHIVAVAPDAPTAQRAIEAGFDTLERLEKMMSDYDPNSELSALNRQAFEKPVAVSEELFEVISAAVEFSRLSEGAFDITIAPVVQVWRRAKQTAVAPTEQELANAKAKVGWQHLRLDAAQRTVQFAQEGMALDLGGIAKGYAADKAVAAMRAAGAVGGLVDIGGDMTCFGKPADGKSRWRIGLQDPTQDEQILLRLELEDHAIATSGDYRRFVMLDGKRYSHIINPASATSVSELCSVSIIAPTGMQADALATAVSVLGEQKGRELVEKLPDVEAILIRSDQPDALIFTSGMSRYLPK